MKVLHDNLTCQLNCPKVNGNWSIITNLSALNLHYTMGKSYYFTT